MITLYSAPICFKPGLLLDSISFLILTSTCGEGTITSVLLYRKIKLKNIFEISFKERESYKSGKVISLLTVFQHTVLPSPLLSHRCPEVFSSPSATPITVSHSIRKQLQRPSASKHRQRIWVTICPGRFFYYLNQS